MASILVLPRLTNCWLMAVIGHGAPGTNADGTHVAALVTRLLYSGYNCGSRIVPIGTPVLTVFLRSSQTQSAPIERPGSGATIPPTDHVVDLAGSKVRVAAGRYRELRVAVGIVAAVRRVRVRTAQRIRLAGADVACPTGVHNWYSVGAAKPVPHEPRSNAVLPGCQRRLNFGFVVLPKSL